MASFSLAITKVFDWEGEYSDHPADRGGETFFGISRRYNPDWEGWEYVDVGDYTTARALAVGFYRRMWENLNLEKVKEQEVAEFIFDSAVNLHPATAVRLLQKSLRLCGRKLLKVDGILGPKTLWAVNSTDSDRLLTIFRAYRAHYYIERIENGYGEEFIYGWLRRISIPGLLSLFREKLIEGSL